MRISIDHLSLLKEEELDFIEDSSLIVEDGKIRAIGGRSRAIDTKFDGSGLLAIPGLIDGHVHIGDSVAKDVGVGKSLEELVKPIHGIKTQFLANTPKEQLKMAIRSSLNVMIGNGITTFVDFREGGAGGAELLMKILSNNQPRALILARPNYYFDPENGSSDGFPREALTDLERVFPKCYGIGLSGANELTDRAMEEVDSIAERYGKFMAIHAAESMNSVEFSRRHFAKSEVNRIYDHLRPSLLVHLTNSSFEDRRLVAENMTPVCVCPRANGILGVGVPPILDFLDRGVIVMLGTDNVMLNSPDLFREMDHTSKVVRAISKNPAIISPKDILKMTTVNAAKALGMKDKIGSLSPGKMADIVFLDKNSANLSPMNDPVAAVVHRACSSDIKAVMLEGRIVYGKLSTSN